MRDNGPVQPCGALAGGLSVPRLQRLSSARQLQHLLRPRVPALALKSRLLPPRPLLGEQHLQMLLSWQQVLPLSPLPLLKPPQPPRRLLFFRHLRWRDQLRRLQRAVRLLPLAVRAPAPPMPLLLLQAASGLASTCSSLMVALLAMGQKA